MENQHRHIKGYRDLTEADIALINECKQKGAELAALIDRIEGGSVVSEGGPDRRAPNLARTNIQQGFMWLIRSIAKPGSFV